MDKFFTKSLSLLLLTMPAMVLTVHHGVSISGRAILLWSLIILISRYPIDMTLNKKEKILIFSLILLPVVVAFDVSLRGLSLRYLDYYLRFVLVIPIYFALREVKISLTPLIIGILVGSVGAGIFALYQKYYVNEFDVHGHISRINFGNISLLLGTMSLAGLFLVKEIRLKKAFCSVTLLAFILGVTGSILSGSRGGWIAIPFFVGLFIMYFPVNKNYKIVSVFILLITIVSIYNSNQYVKSRVNLAYTNTEAYFSIDNSKATKTSAGIRLELWKAVRIIFTEHPVAGIGSGQFKLALKKLIDAGEIKKIKLYDHAHNESLQLLVSIGIIGFLAYLTLYAGMTYYFYSSLILSNINKVKYLSFLGLMTVGAYFIFGLTNYTFGHHLMVLFFAVMVAIFAGMIKNIENELKGDHSAPNLLPQGEG